MLFIKSCIPSNFSEQLVTKFTYAEDKSDSSRTILRILHNISNIFDLNSILIAMRRETFTIQERLETANNMFPIMSDEVERFFAFVIQALLHDTP